MKRVTVIFFVLTLITSGFFWALANRKALAKINLSVRQWWYENSPFSPSPIKLSADEIAAERRDHDEQIHQLNLRLIQKDAEIFELEKTLSEFENFRRALPQLQSVAANLIGRTFVSDEIIVAAGTEAGVETGWAAAQGLAIVGVVGITAERASKILLTSNSGCLLPARSERSREICLVRGAGRERAIATFYAGQSAVAPGERLLTSGILGKIPAGLIVGVVEGFPRRGTEPGTLVVEVNLAANFSAIESILLISPIPANNSLPNDALKIPASPPNSSRRQK